ncbi:hypothetical protein Tco_1068087 [Tanacetum coccineum]|uniref:Zinc knuckle CX2CX4HX4C n=1 Tax=Tanacetum coccineum TaxID=301880 RepID=A0ABQ5HGL2_9ASTR
MDTKLGNPIMLDSYTSSMCLQSLGHMDYARALIDIRANRELKEDMVIAIPNVEDDGEVLHTIMVEYEWEPPRCVVCMLFGHVDILCSKRSVGKPKKQHTNLDASHGTNVDSKVLLKPKKPVTSLDQMRGRLIQESRMIEGKLVLLGDDEKPLKPCKPTPLSSSNVISKKADDLVNEDSDSEVEEVYDETATFMASTSSNVNKVFKSNNGGGNKILYKQWKESHGCNGVFDIGESNAKSMEVRNKFDEFLENKKSVEEVVVGGGEVLGVDKDESNRVSVLKDVGGEFDDCLDEINLGLSEEFVIRVLEGRDVFGESLVVFLNSIWVQIQCGISGVNKSSFANKDVDMGKEAKIQRTI